MDLMLSPKYSCLFREGSTNTGNNTREDVFDLSMQQVNMLRLTTPISTYLSPTSSARDASTAERTLLRIVPLTRAPPTGKTSLTCSTSWLTQMSGLRCRGSWTISIRLKSSTGDSVIDWGNWQFVDVCVFTGHRGVEHVGSSLTLVLCLTNATPRQGLDDKSSRQSKKKKTLDKWRYHYPPGWPTVKPWVDTAK